MGITLGVILARGGSKGVPRKNLYKLCGKPLIGYTINAAQNAKSLDRIVLSTEDDEIASVASQYGIEVIKRPIKYATDTSPIDLALRHTVREIEQKGIKIDILAPLYANIPIRQEGIIDKVINTLKSTGCDSVQTYSPYRTPPQWAYILKNDIPVLLDEKYSFAYRRQLVEQAYHPDGAAIALRRDVLMNSEGLSTDPRAFMGNNRRAVIQSPEATVDVDEPIDLLWAEFLLNRQK